MAWMCSEVALARLSDTRSPVHTGEKSGGEPAGPGRDGRDEAAPAVLGGDALLGCRVGSNSTRCPLELRGRAATADMVEAGRLALDDTANADAPAREPTAWKPGVSGGMPGPSPSEASVSLPSRDAPANGQADTGPAGTAPRLTTAAGADAPMRSSPPAADGPPERPTTPGVAEAAAFAEAAARTGGKPSSTRRTTASSQRDCDSIATAVEKSSRSPTLSGESSKRCSLRWRRCSAVVRFRRRRPLPTFPSRMGADRSASRATRRRGAADVTAAALLMALLVLLSKRRWMRASRFASSAYLRSSEALSARCFASAASRSLAACSSVASRRFAAALAATDPADCFCSTHAFHAASRSSEDDCGCLTADVERIPAARKQLRSGWSRLLDRSRARRTHCAWRKAAAGELPEASDVGDLLVQALRCARHRPTV